MRKVLTVQTAKMKNRSRRHTYAGRANRKSLYIVSSGKGGVRLFLYFPTIPDGNYLERVGAWHENSPDNFLEQRILIERLNWLLELFEDIDTDVFGFKMCFIFCFLSIFIMLMLLWGWFCKYFFSILLWYCFISIYCFAQIVV